MINNNKNKKIKIEKQKNRKFKMIKIKLNYSNFMIIWKNSMKIDMKINLTLIKMLILFMRYQNIIFH